MVLYPINFPFGPHYLRKQVTFSPQGPQQAHGTTFAFRKYDLMVQGVSLE